MRFLIICLVSFLLIAPPLVTSKRYSPPPRPAPPTPPTHGDLVRYQAHVPHAGIVVGSQPDRSGHVNIAPLAPAESQRPGHTAFYSDRIVNAHPANIARMGISSPHVASDLASHHEQHPPWISYIEGHVEGSPNHRAAQPNGGRSGSQRSERTWRQ